MVEPTPSTCAPTTFSSCSAKRLSDGTSVSCTIRDSGGEATEASSSAVSGAVPSAAALATGTPALFSAVVSCWAANWAGCLASALPFSFASPRL